LVVVGRVERRNERSGDVYLPLSPSLKIASYLICQIIVVSIG
jgi:hypothetical protein